MNKNKNINIIKNNIKKNRTDEQKQKRKEYKKENRKNMTDEQKQKIEIIKKNIEKI